MIHSIEPFLNSPRLNPKSRQCLWPSPSRRLKSLEDSISAQNKRSSISVEHVFPHTNPGSDGMCSEVQFRLSYLSEMFSRVSPEYTNNSQ